MRHQHKHLEKEHEVKMELTPMIDLTFLLVMFFVLTSQITTLNLEEVVLPVAIKSDEMGEELTLIVNIPKRNDVTREGEIIFNGQKHTQDTLKTALQLEASVDAQRRGTEPSPVQGGQPLSKLEVLIRPDEGVRGEYLRQVFVACQQAGIYRVKISALQPE